MNTSKYVAPNTVFDSSVAFLRNTTFDSSVYLQGVTHISDPSISVAGTPYALVVESIGTDVEIKAKQLGTMAFETSTNYYSKPEVDGIVDNLESSIGALDVLTQQHTTDIADISTRLSTLDVADLSTRVGDLETSVGILNGIIQTHDGSITYLFNWDLAKDASIVELRAKDASQDASIAALDLLTQNLEASIVRIDASLNDVVDITEIIDASLNILYEGLDDVSSRVDDLETWQTATDASIVRIDGSINYLWSWDLAKDASIVALRAKDASQDASIAALDLYVQDLSTRIGTIDDWQTYVDGSLNRLIAKDASQDASINALDLLTQQHTSDIANVSTNKLDAVANINVVGDASLFSYETGTVAYLKKLLAGSGIVITEDTSTITIAGDFASTVAKYTNTFSGVGSASLGILESTHNLGAGPLDVTVYENNQAVYPDIDCDANGNIVINWAPGSLGANCKYVIMG